MTPFSAGSVRHEAPPVPGLTPIAWLRTRENAGPQYCHLSGCEPLPDEQNAKSRTRPPVGTFCRLPGCACLLEETEGAGRPSDFCDRKHSDLFYKRRDQLDAALEEITDLTSRRPALPREQKRAFDRRYRTLAEARACYVKAAELPLLRSDPTLARFPWIEALVINFRRASRPDDHLCEACNGEGFMQLGLRKDGQSSAPSMRPRRALYMALLLIQRIDTETTKQAWYEAAYKYATGSNYWYPLTEVPQHAVSTFEEFTPDGHSPPHRETSNLTTTQAPRLRP